MVSLIRREQLDTKEGWQAFVLRLERAQTDENAKSSGLALAEWLHDEAIRGIDLQFYELRCLELNGLEVCICSVKCLIFQYKFSHQVLAQFPHGSKTEGSREFQKFAKEIGLTRQVVLDAKSTDSAGPRISRWVSEQSGHSGHSACEVEHN